MEDSKDDILGLRRLNFCILVNVDCDSVFEN